MVKRTVKGSLLFETFIALMILSIGIVSTLRVFGEALFVGERNRERMVVIQGIDRLLFPWFANPGDTSIPEAGALTLPLSGNSRETEHWAEIEARNLGGKTGESNQERKTRLSKASQYYQVTCRIAKESQQEVLNLETVIFKIKQPKNYG